MEKIFKNNHENNIVANVEVALENTTFKKAYIRPYAQIIDMCGDIVRCSGGCPTDCCDTDPAVDNSLGILCEDNQCYQVSSVIVTE